MPNYQNGKIYILRSHQTDDVYIGSTTQTLAQRKGQHINNYKRYTNSKEYSNYMSSYEIVKHDDFYIELLELYPCNKKCELHTREGYYIRSMKCVNKCIPCRTLKQYYQDNRKEILEKSKQYHLANIDKRREKERERYHRTKNNEHVKEVDKRYRAQRYICECGQEIYKYNKAPHVRTKTHNILINNKDVELSEEDKKIKYICECGIIVHKRNKCRHNTAKLHINIMKNKNACLK